MAGRNCLCLLSRGAMFNIVCCVLTIIVVSRHKPKIILASVDIDASSFSFVPRGSCNKNQWYILFACFLHTVSQVPQLGSKMNFSILRPCCNMVATISI